jgi:tripartite-type tricarboxylate transporter receptor subunit TctC
MKLPRRKFLHLAAGAAALPVVQRFAWAQAYPSRPVRIIVGAAPSGTYDIMARLIGEWLSERLGQPFVIENRPGAGTTIGTEAVVKAPQMVIRSCLSAQRPQPARCSMTNSISISSGTSRLSRPSAASPTLWW